MGFIQVLSKGVNVRCPHPSMRYLTPAAVASFAVMDASSGRSADRTRGRVWKEFRGSSSDTPDCAGGMPDVLLGQKCPQGAACCAACSRYLARWVPFCGSYALTDKQVAWLLHCSTKRTLGCTTPAVCSRAHSYGHSAQICAIFRLKFDVRRAR